MPISVIPLTLAAVLLFQSVRLAKKLFLQTKNQYLYYFYTFLKCFLICSSLTAVCSLLSPFNSQIAGYLLPLAIFAGGIGLAYFARLGLKFFLPKYEENLFYLFIIGNVINAVLLFSDLPGVISYQNLTLWSIPSAQALFISIAGLTILFITIILFVNETINNTRINLYPVKKRLIMLTAGILTYLAGGLAHVFIQVPINVLIADIANFLGTVLIFVAIMLFYKKPFYLNNV